MVVDKHRGTLRLGDWYWILENTNDVGDVQHIRNCQLYTLISPTLASYNILVLKKLNPIYRRGSLHYNLSLLRRGTESYAGILGRISLSLEAMF